MKKFNIIKNSYLRIVIGIMRAAAALTLFFMNFRLSIQFTGGIDMKIKSSISNEELNNKINQYLTTNALGKPTVGIQDENGVKNILINISVEDDIKVNEISNKLGKFLSDEKIITSQSDIIESTIIGPSIGSYMQSSAINAIIRGLAFMSIYMIFAFREIRRHISPGALAFITILTMFFDILSPAGIYGIWMSIDPTITIDAVFIVAILTTMGYSINDTIIIFDRIRENIIKYKDELANGKMKYGTIFEDSLRQTMRRSLGTSISLLLVILGMVIFGEGLLKHFAITMLFGVASGTYSSIFLAAPIAYILMGKYKKELK